MISLDQLRQAFVSVFPHSEASDFNRGTGWGGVRIQIWQFELVGECRLGKPSAASLSNTQQPQRNVSARVVRASITANTVEEVHEFLQSQKLWLYGVIAELFLGLEGGQPNESLGADDLLRDAFLTLD